MFCIDRACRETTGRRGNGLFTSLGKFDKMVREENRYDSFK